MRSLLQSVVFRWLLNGLLGRFKLGTFGTGRLFTSRPPASIENRCEYLIVDQDNRMLTLRILPDHSPYF